MTAALRLSLNQKVFFPKQAKQRKNRKKKLGKTFLFFVLDSELCSCHSRVFKKQTFRPGWGVILFSFLRWPFVDQAVFNWQSFCLKMFLYYSVCKLITLNPIVFWLFSRKEFASWPLLKLLSNGFFFPSEFFLYFRMCGASWHFRNSKFNMFFHNTGDDL